MSLSETAISSEKICWQWLCYKRRIFGLYTLWLRILSKALTGIVLAGLINLILDIKNCFCQGYVGAAVVSGHINGLSVYNWRINSKAIYTQGYSHRLNLFIGASCNMQCVKNFLDQVKEIPYFFKFSAPRKKVLINSVKEHAPDSQKKSLFDFHSIQKVKKITGLDNLKTFLLQFSYFILRKWVWTWGVCAIKIHNQRILHFIN